MNSGLKTTALLWLAMLSAALFEEQAEPARPGTMNHVEGEAYSEGKQSNPRNVRDIEMNTGQALTTGYGIAQILLTPDARL